MSDKAVLNILSREVKEIISTNPMIQNEIGLLLEAISDNDTRKTAEMLLEVMSSVFSVTVKETIIYFTSEDEFEKLIVEAQEERVSQQMAELERELFNG
jgi:N-acyl-D-aspartate/D-glutamate deacylase